MVMSDQIFSNITSSFYYTYRWSEGRWVIPRI